jgi:hypothetical protein
MLVTENIAFRLREWLDRREEEPDLVPRLRRLWKAPAVARLPQHPPSVGAERRLLRRATLAPRPGM